MEHTIYSNYDLWDEWYYDALNYLTDEKGIPESEITDSEMWDEIYTQDDIEFEIRFRELTNYFNKEYRNRKFILFGSIGRWDGYRTGFDTFDSFKDLFDFAVTDCDYIEIYEEDNHFYIKGSHHDGTSEYEVKVLTERGESYLDNWEWEYPEKRSASYVCKQLVKRYSVLPRFTERYGF